MMQELKEITPTIHQRAASILANENTLFILLVCPKVGTPAELVNVSPEIVGNTPLEATNLLIHSFCKTSPDHAQICMINGYEELQAMQQQQSSIIVPDSAGKIIV